MTTTSATKCCAAAAQSKKIQQELGVTDFATVSREVGERWSKLSAEDKAAAAHAGGRDIPRMPVMFSTT